ncbi:PIN domain protein [Variibacter gotjawalensis]|uniref:PIN domain protein n=1 Tax=Variibacter gotjawalensis TaxID=1333996 RepID=A0A0S3PQS7_9BRAD|nr:type II toxin-antitoxin system VapC family toxin [Variibacter gotjawalensis]NIK48624.1 PIN domain nuclease of toxin-antitoxin system [Variibacter gotjawalensis]RZS50488.1 PIN domain nuclease of toxin-antitoxin system [Variibacter gotjawalensis]BAT58322.1 PIN domain protein [Variibacter gotjawalensis]
MRLLLDTHIFLWIRLDDRRLSPKARKRIIAADAIFVSSVSFLEIAIKSRAGKLKADLDEMLVSLDERGFTELAVSARHTVAVHDLPTFHPDPFDLLLIAQAEVEDMRLMTADAQVAAYSDRIILV